MCAVDSPPCAVDHQGDHVTLRPDHEATSMMSVPDGRTRRPWSSQAHILERSHVQQVQLEDV